MERVILVSPYDSEDSPVTAWRGHRASSGRSLDTSRYSREAITTTSGTTVVFNLEARRPEFQIVDESMLSNFEDEIDRQDALEALAEAREKGTISHAELKAEFGL